MPSRPQARPPLRSRSIILFALLVYWGMLYLDDHGGGFNAKVYQPYASYTIVADRQPVTDPLTAAMNEGGKLFNANCAVCHQANGSGATCPPLAGSDWATADGQPHHPAGPQWRRRPDNRQRQTDHSRRHHACL